MESLDDKEISYSQSDQINEIAKAMIKVQGILKPAPKDSTNPYYNSTYSDLTSVWNACREALTSNDICVIQRPFGDTHGNIGVNCLLIHSSGQWLSSSLYAKLSKNDPQIVGSAITYFRRYSLAAMVGIVQEDDDGEGAKKGRDNAPTPPTQPNNNEKKLNYKAPQSPLITDIMDIMDIIITDIVDIKNSKTTDELKNKYEACKKKYRDEHLKKINIAVNERKKQLESKKDSKS